MPLMSYGGKLLLAPSGKLAGSEECCCDNLDCPACCARILAGALLDEQIHFIEIGDPYSLEGEITTPSGTRVICEDDEITITFRTDPSLGVGVSPGAFANWDVVWEFVSMSPEVSGVDGSSEERGYVEWGDTIEQEYTLTLRYNPCWNRETAGLGLIQIGFAELGLTHDVVVDTCPVQNCCNPPEPCEPCCYRIENGAYFDGGWWLYMPIDDDIYALIKTTLRPDSRLICVGEGFSVEVFIGSRNSNPILVDVEINTAAFLYAGCDPAADEEPDDGEAGGDVRWLDRSEREFKVDLTIGCEPNEFGNGINVIVTNKQPGGGSGNDGPDFDYCENTTECTCCCRKWCEQGCYFPVDPRACDYDPIEEPDGPWTKVENMVMTYVASENVWNQDGVDEDDNPIYTCDTYRFEQTGPSVHSITCDVCGCPKSNGIFDIPMQAYYCDEPFGDPFTIRIFRQDYTMGTYDFYEFGDISHIWVVQSLTAATYWFPAPDGLDGSGFPEDYDYTGDCTGATVSHSVVIEGVTYTTNFSFDLVTGNGSTHAISACEAEDGEDTGWIEGEYV